MSELQPGLDAERLQSTARDIQRDHGAEAVEILARTSRARVVTFELERSGHLAIESQGSQEVGHTVRHNAGGRWGAWSATGAPRSPERPPPTASGQLVFPDPRKIRELRAMAAGPEMTSRARVLERPLLGESDARRWIDRLVETVTTTLERDAGEAAPSFHLLGRLEDGAAESLLVNSHGVVAPGRSRVTGVRLEMSLGSRSASTYLAANDDLPSGSALALERLVGELSLRHSARRLDRAEDATVLLRPPALAPLLARLGSRFWRPTGTDSMTPPDESAGVSLWDRPDLAAGFLGGERDGEGLHAQRSLLMDHDGVHPVVPWERLAEGDDAHLGFRWRASWRELPRFGPSHLELRFDPEVPERCGDLEHGVVVVGLRGGLASDRGDLLFDALGYRVAAGERTEPLRMAVRIPEAGLLARLDRCSGEVETHTLPTCAVSCPSAVFEGLRLEPPSTT